ncbi:MocR-like pyridoxine biosynthesis transcription factor PdxR [Flavobacterium psychrotrophum]|uniref:MocR-like pyridoxine biosynthesis transcription factor PdxR n=1 Tax=Flavobacterium psychrotrophum TaxID=2294119 RepID=UPI000E30E4B1|nr:PLP-dependent aminotransferase family protein [Flavobacterium psychrotrophum]
MLRAWKLEFEIDAKSGKAIYLQIADAVIRDIQTGRLKPGEALPGSRNLAQLLKVNRNTVIEALNVLLLEGWLVSRERSGTFVSDELPKAGAKDNRPQDTYKSAEHTKVYRIKFDDGHPDTGIAPITELARAYRQIFNQKGKWRMMGYSSELGNRDFREAVAQMLSHQRAMQVNYKNICITRGSQMAMYLTAQTLIDEGDCVIVENPGYQPAWEALQHAGAKLLPAAVDKEGIVLTDILTYLNSNVIKAVYVTPHRQYPTTVSLSLRRRLELVALSNKYGFTIIEDDYDNEFHFGYRPILPLASFAELDNYVYIGTMSKVVAPALRIGFLVSSNPAFIERVAGLRRIIDVQGDNIMEQAVLQLIKDGTIKKHIKKATAHYRVKRDNVAILLNKHLGQYVDYTIPDGGLAFWVVPKTAVNWEELTENLKGHGIKIISPTIYGFNQQAFGLRLGYGSLPESELEEALMKMAKYFEKT